MLSLGRLLIERPNNYLHNGRTSPAFHGGHSVTLFAGEPSSDPWAFAGENASPQRWLFRSKRLRRSAWMLVCFHNLRKIETLIHWLIKEKKITMYVLQLLLSFAANWWLPLCMSYDSGKILILIKIIIVSESEKEKKIKFGICLWDFLS